MVAPGSHAGRRRPHRGLVTAGFLLAVGCLLLPLLWLPALIVGIVALARGRVAAGIAVLVLSQALSAAGGFLYQALVVKPYRVPSASMAPTLTVGERFLVDRMSYRFNDPEIGDIVVFKPPAGATAATGECGAAHRPDQPCPRPTPRSADVTFVKRIVAGPGDRVAIRGGRLVRNGEQESEPYVRPCAGPPACDLPRETVVPPGHWFVLGDSRGESADSREWGPVPTGWLVGRRLLTYWPPGR